MPSTATYLEVVEQTVKMEEFLYEVREGYARCILDPSSRVQAGLQMAWGCHDARADSCVCKTACDLDL